MTGNLTIFVIFAFVLVIGIIWYILANRKKQPILKKARSITTSSQPKDYVPLILLIVVSGIVLIQSIGYIISEYFGLNWVAWGFLLKGVGLVLLLYLIYSLIKRNFRFDNPMQFVIFIIALALIIFVMVGLEKVIPQFFSATNLFSASQIFG